MGNLGFQEIILIFVIALIVFGPRKLPEIGKSLGRSMAEFRKASQDLRNTWEEEVRAESEKIKQDVGTIDTGEEEVRAESEKIKQDVGTIDAGQEDFSSR